MRTPLPRRVALSARNGAKLAVDDARDLYAFWGDKLARVIAPAGSNATIVNLASVEYAKAVLPHLAGDATVVTCLFGEGIRNGKPIQRSTASKRHVVPWCAGWQKTSSRM